MNIQVKFTGTMEQIIDAAIDEGLAKTKTEALRLGLIELNNKYALLSRGAEDELALRKMRQIDEELKKGKRKLLSEKEALSKYA